MIPEFENKELMFDWLRANKRILETKKKSEKKLADAVDFVLSVNKDSENIVKTESEGNGEPLKVIKVKAVINTTNLMDSHSDVHIPGLWKKTLSENRDLYLLKEHNLSFDYIISDNVTASTKSISWSKLGYQFEGNTEALIFDAEIKQEENEQMFSLYTKGKVKQHSVGMRYVKLFLCMDSDSKFDVDEKANWDKYFPMVANKSDVQEQGYFWAVTEAKVIEGSAVPLGSNYATPTISVEPVQSTQQAQKQEVEPISSLNYTAIANAIKSRSLTIKN